MADSYVLAGVDSATARLCAAKNPKGFSQPETFFEVVGRGSAVQEALQSRRTLNIEELHAMDMRTLRSDGVPCDFNNKAHTHDARTMQHDLKTLG